MPDYNTFSGYLDFTIDSKDRMHYMFVESASLPKDHPVILWLGGSPRCSKLDGYFYDIGPFTYSLDDEKVTTRAGNEYTWNDGANLLFLEYPLGVGFSETTSSKDYTDTQVAFQVFTGLQLFYKKFPEFVDNELWLAGHYYAGIIAPTVAYYVQQYNREASLVRINLKGLLLNNPITDFSVDLVPARISMAYKRVLFDTEYLDSLEDICAGGYTGEECVTELSAVNTTLFSNLNFFDIYRDCASNDEIASKYLNPNNEETLLEEFPICFSTEGIEAFFTNNAYRTSLHITTVSDWHYCSSDVRFT